MDNITVRDIEELSKTKGQPCISLFLPTSNIGHGLNTDTEKINYKKNLQVIKSEMTAKSFEKKYIENFIKPAYDLLDDATFWHNLQEGLAVFLSEEYFKAGNYPIRFSKKHFVATEFMVTPLLPLLNGAGEYHLLVLKHDNIKLYKGSKFNLRELPIQEIFPPNIFESIKHYDLEKSFQGRAMTAGMQFTKAHFHGYGIGKDDDYKYLKDLFRQVDRGINALLSQEHTPLVIAGVEYLVPVYREVNTYKNSLEEGFTFTGSHEDTTKDIHDKSRALVTRHQKQSGNRQKKKYKELAETGKTSSKIEDIFISAIEGKVESFFFEKDATTWATINQNNEIIVHERQEDQDICLINASAINVILNNGMATEIDQGELPEKGSGSKVAAVYRY